MSIAIKTWAAGAATRSAGCPHILTIVVTLPERVAGPGRGTTHPADPAAPHLARPRSTNDEPTWEDAEWQ